MRRLTIIGLLSTQLFIACGTKKDVETEVISVQESEIVMEDDIEPPPPGFVSRFKSLEEWLVNICKERKPQKAIAKYNLDLFEAADGYTLSLTGVNEYKLSQNETAVRIDFFPAEMYFDLPESEYKSLNRQEVIDRLTTKLKDFVNTEKFKKSFLSDADAIATSWQGQIWSK